MLQFIMERNLLLYVLSAACIVGVASQMILRQIYDRLIRDTKNTGETNGKFLQQLRQRFQYCSHLNEKVGDVHALIQKGMMEYRFWGMSLHRWKRIGLDCLVVSLLCAAGGSVYIMQGGGALFGGNQYLWMGVLAAGLLAAAYGIADTGYRRECLEVRLTDYLENSGAVRDYSENPEEELEMMDMSQVKTVTVTPITPVMAGRKAKKRARAESAAAAQTRAQKEKNDLKENLARIKAGMQETAAERDREKNLELLRQMDPNEQERILREVLQGILS